MDKQSKSEKNLFAKLRGLGEKTRTFVVAQSKRFKETLESLLKGESKFAAKLLPVLIGGVACAALALTIYFYKNPEKWTEAREAASREWTKLTGAMKAGVSAVIEHVTRITGNQKKEETAEAATSPEAAVL